MDGPLRAEKDRPLVHPHAFFRARVSFARLLQKKTSGQSGNFPFPFLSFKRILIFSECALFLSFPCVLLWPEIFFF